MFFVSLLIILNIILINLLFFWILKLFLGFCVGWGDVPPPLEGVDVLYSVLHLHLRLSSETNQEESFFYTWVWRVKAVRFFETSGTIKLPKQRHIQEDRNSKRSRSNTCGLQKLWLRGWVWILRLPVTYRNCGSEVGFEFLDCLWLIETVAQRWGLNS
jgi:hypothetical protein